jgi:hypothetical protein
MRHSAKQLFRRLELKRDGRHQIRRKIRSHKLTHRPLKRSRIHLDERQCHCRTFHHIRWQPVMVFLQTNTTGYYRLHTDQKEDFAALDVYAYNGKNTIDLHMFAAHDATGQYWRFNKQDDGSFRINNQYTGPDIYVDVVKDSLQPTLAARDGPGQ